MTDFTGFAKMRYLWRTDVKGQPITIVGLEEFNRVARGGTGSGVPTVATIHSHDAMLEFYPIPNSNYSVGAYLKKKITGLEDIPDQFHDVVVDYGIVSIQATKDAAVAVEMLKQGIKDLLNSSMIGWAGDTIPISRHLGADGGRATSDSQNLRPT